MNNTKNILLLAIVTATLVLGTSVIPMQSYASEEHKENSDLKSSIKSGTDVDKNGASQHSGQDNFAYRSGDPSQSNQGQQVIGKDNEATGFNDQSGNLKSTPATTEAAGGTGNNTGSNGNGTTPTPTPTTGTLNVCKVVNNGQGFNFKPSNFTFAFTSEGADPAEFAGSADCIAVTVPEGPYSFGEILNAPALFTTTASGDCTQDCRFIPAFHGSINAGDTQTCTVTNNIGIRTPI